MKNIRLIYLSNLLTGLVFWYGVTASYYNSVGISAAEAGVGLAFISVFAFIFDIPSGIVADKWSRKRMLQASALFLGLTSLFLMIFPGNFIIFLLAYGLFYGLYIVCSSGSYQAITYDCLHEINMSSNYSKIQGRAWGLYVAGAGVANVFSGYLFNSHKSTIFIFSIISALLNILILSLIDEPNFHKASQSKSIKKDIAVALRAIRVNKLLRNIILALSSLWVIQTFVYDYSQYWFLSFYDNNIWLGWFWAAFAFIAALGGIVAHKTSGHIDLILGCTLFTAAAFSIWNSPYALIFFLIHCFFVGINNNLIETIVQDYTTSSVRASVMSVISTLGRSIAIPTYLLFGYLIRSDQLEVVLKIMTITVVIIATVYYISRIRRIRDHI